MRWRSRLPELSTLSDVLQVGQAAFAALWLLIPLLGIALTFFLGFPSVAIATLLSATFVLGIIGSFNFFRRRRRSLKTDWNPYIWMRTWKNTLRVLNAAEVESSNFINLKILRDDVSRFNWRIAWTGEGEIDIWIKNPGFRSELRPASTDPFQVLIIHFDRPRSKGETFDLEFGILATGSSKPQQPFHSLVLFESRTPKEVTLRVEFADDLVVRSIQKETYVSAKSPWPMEPPVPLSLDRNRIIEWSLDCHSGRRYGVRWEMG